jgi:predicted DNA binding CopG/RHH family protein
MKKIPEFKNENDERNFWASADSTEYLDWESGKGKKLTQLKPSLKTISLRLPASMIEDLKVLANRRDVPYQSLLKVFLAERLAQERGSKPVSTAAARVVERYRENKP